MSEVDRVEGPSAVEIEKRFRSLRVVVARPVILGGLSILSVARRFGYLTRPAHGLEFLLCLPRLLLQCLNSGIQLRLFLARAPLAVTHLFEFVLRGPLTNLRLALYAL